MAGFEVITEEQHFAMALHDLAIPPGNLSRLRSELSASDETLQGCPGAGAPAA